MSGVALPFQSSFLIPPLTCAPGATTGLSDAHRIPSPTTAVRVSTARFASVTTRPRTVPAISSGPSATTRSPVTVAPRRIVTGPFPTTTLRATSPAFRSTGPRST